MQGARRRRMLAGVLACVVLFAVSCSGDDSDDSDDAEDASGGPSSTTQQDEQPTPELIDPGADFYAAPDPIPAGEHGDLLRYQVVDGAPEGVTWYRVMYLSESLAGDPIAVTGVVTVPTAAPPADGWPLVSHAHGSTGLDDPCAPSVSLTGDRMWAIEIMLMSNYVGQRGVVIASTDYEGLGGPGMHPFLVGESEGRGVLDIALAARQLPDVTVGDRTAITGYSQGGHAALWANQIAADWTPSLDVIGTMAGAPASEPLALSEQAPAELGQQFYLTLVAGLAAAYPDADPSEILTPAGMDVVERLATECPPLANVDPATQLLQEPLANSETWSQLLEENTPGHDAAPSPILVVHSAEDANVPIGTSVTLLDRLCAAGQVVERRVLPTGDHVSAAVPAYQQGLDWFDSLWNGDEPTSSCT